MQFRKLMATAMVLPVLALSLAACSSSKDTTIDEPESGVGIVEEESVIEMNQSGDIVNYEETQIVTLTLTTPAKAHLDADSHSESMGTLAEGTYPVVEIKDNWKAVVVADRDGGQQVVWTDAEGELVMAEVGTVTDEGK